MQPHEGLMYSTAQKESEAHKKHQVHWPGRKAQCAQRCTALAHGLRHTQHTFLHGKRGFRESTLLFSALIKHLHFLHLLQVPLQNWGTEKDTTILPSPGIVEFKALTTHAAYSKVMPPYSVPRKWL